MPFRYIVISLLLSLTLVGSAQSQSLRQARIVPLPETERLQLITSAQLSTADTCLGSPVDTITHIILDWVIGNELYKNYIDPELNGCGYPYTITEVNMPMYFQGAAAFSVSVDIEAVDNTSHPGCHVPGPMLTLSTDWEVTIPAEGGFFDIWIPLDSPITVDGPFFAGFFIGTEIDAAAGAAIAIDSTRKSLCTSFNIWDTEIGFIDLLSNEYWNFPGQLVLYVSGYANGGSSEPKPDVAFVNPVDGDVIYEATELWGMDRAGSDILEYLSFEYYNGSNWIEIGRDFDGASPLRDGVNSTINGHGFSLPWNFTALGEGEYLLRATLVDTLGRSSEQVVSVYLEPSPPVPEMISPNEMADFCPPLGLIMNCNDEDVSSIQVEWQTASDDYAAGLITFDQSRVGDTDGDPLDGNAGLDGEYGDFYNAPVAAAIAVKLWYDRGYTDVMREGINYISVEELAENLAAEMSTRQTVGTFDERFVYGLKQYLGAHGNDLKVEYRRNPDYLTLRKWVEGEHRAVMIGANGNSGLWLAVEGFKGWPSNDSTLITVSVPMTGTKMDLWLRNTYGIYELQYGDWYLVDMAVALDAADWQINREFAGIDFNRDDGWSINWTPVDPQEDTKYYFHPYTVDAAGNYGSSLALLQLNCSQQFEPGDFDGNEHVDIADLTALISFLTVNGPPPVGGSGRADMNCDSFINAADIVYLINYLYGKNDPPCH